MSGILFSLSFLIYLSAFQIVDAYLLIGRSLSVIPFSIEENEAATVMSVPTAVNGLTMLIVSKTFPLILKHNPDKSWIIFAISVPCTLIGFGLVVL